MARASTARTSSVGCLGALLITASCKGQITDSLLQCCDWTQGAAPAAAPAVVATGAAWVRADPAGRFLAYRSAQGVRVRRIATGEEKSVGLADDVSVFVEAVDGARFVAFYSDRSQGFQEYVLVDSESCEWRPLGIKVSTSDPVIGFSTVSTMSLASQRVFYAIDRGSLQSPQELLLDLTDSSRQVAQASGSAITESQVAGDRAVWLEQKGATGTPSVVAWSFLDGGLLPADLPAKASPRGLSASDTNAVWTDSRDVTTPPADTNIYMMDLQNGSVTPLTTDRNSQQDPSILRNLVAWSDNRGGNFDIMVRDLDTGSERVVASTPEDERLPILTESGLFWQVLGPSGATVWFDPTVHP